MIPFSLQIFFTIYSLQTFIKLTNIVNDTELLELIIKNNLVVKKIDLQYLFQINTEYLILKIIDELNLIEEFSEELLYSAINCCNTNLFVKLYPKICKLPVGAI